MWPSHTPFSYMKKFIALDIKDYELKEGVTPINLVWEGKTIRDWCEKVSFTKEDVVIGHSLGAAVALIVAGETPPKELHLYSPSPIFTETIGFLDKKNLDHFGEKRRDDVKPIPMVACPVYVYYGTKEPSMMGITARIIASRLPQGKLIAVRGKDHRTVINQEDIQLIPLEE